MPEGAFGHGVFSLNNTVGVFFQLDSGSTHGVFTLHVASQIQSKAQVVKLDQTTQRNTTTAACIAQHVTVDVHVANATGIVIAGCQSENAKVILATKSIVGFGMIDFVVGKANTQGAVGINQVGIDFAGVIVVAFGDETNLGAETAQARGLVAELAAFIIFFARISKFAIFPVLTMQNSPSLDLR